MVANTAPVVTIVNPVSSPRWAWATAWPSSAARSTPSTATSPRAWSGPRAWPAASAPEPPLDQHAGSRNPRHHRQSHRSARPLAIENDHRHRQNRSHRDLLLDRHARWLRARILGNLERRRHPQRRQPAKSATIRWTSSTAPSSPSTPRHCPTPSRSASHPPGVPQRPGRQRSDGLPSPVRGRRRSRLLRHSTALEAADFSDVTEA